MSWYQHHWLFVSFCWILDRIFFLGAGHRIITICMRSYFGISRNKSRATKVYSNIRYLALRGVQTTPLQTNILPRRFIRFFRRRFRKFFRKKRLFFCIFLNYNFIISNKGKNPRMGKGIGFFVRKVVIIKQNTPVFLFRRSNYTRSKAFSLFFKKKTHLNSFSFNSLWYF